MRYASLNLFLLRKQLSLCRKQRAWPTLTCLVRDVAGKGKIVFQNVMFAS